MSLTDFLAMTCRHDLDNIVLEKLKDTRTMHAIYELEALVLTGEQSFFTAIHPSVSKRNICY